MTRRSHDLKKNRLHINNSVVAIELLRLKGMIEETTGPKAGIDAPETRRVRST